MSNLTKQHVDNLFKKIIVQGNGITIESDFQKRRTIIKSFSTVWENSNKKNYTIKSNNLEQERKKQENEFLRIQKDIVEGTNRYFTSFLKDYKNKDVYAEKQLYEVNKFTTYFLEKYLSSEAIAKETLWCEIVLTKQSKTAFFLYIFFNEKSELCCDFVTIKSPAGYYYRNNITVEDNTKTITCKTSVEILVNFLNVLEKKDEQVKIAKKNSLVKKQKIAKLTINGAVAKIKSIAESMNIDYNIKIKHTNIEFIIDFGKGMAIIKIPQREIRKKLDILPELIDVIVQAKKKHGIECRFLNKG
ncbi:hypothetical protein KAJ27_18295 [bacterium]|nr:hypothetical protein [bacterium]